MALEMRTIRSREGVQEGMNKSKKRYTTSFPHYYLLEANSLVQCKRDALILIGHTAKDDMPIISTYAIPMRCHLPCVVLIMHCIRCPGIE